MIGLVRFSRSDIQPLLHPSQKCLTVISRLFHSRHGFGPGVNTWVLGLPKFLNCSSTHWGHACSFVTGVALQKIHRRLGDDMAELDHVWLKARENIVADVAIHVFDEPSGRFSPLIEGYINQEFGLEVRYAARRQQGDRYFVTILYCEPGQDSELTLFAHEYRRVQGDHGGQQNRGAMLVAVPQLVQSMEQGRFPARSLVQLLILKPGLDVVG